MRKSWLLLFPVFFLACARVSVETKEPIKVDVSMRIDVYQHVVEEVDSIEAQIYGDTEQQLNFNWGIKEVYAADLPAEAAEAIARRKSRAGTVENYLKLGYLGINRAGYLEVISDKVQGQEKVSVSAVASRENNDRRIINSYTASKNKVSLAQVEEVMAKDSFKRVGPGTWVEFYDQDSNSYIWQKK